MLANAHSDFVRLSKDICETVTKSDGKLGDQPSEGCDIISTFSLSL